MSIPVTYVFLSSALSLKGTNSSWDFVGHDILLSPFRWDQQFNAYIIYSPVLFNNTPLEVKDSSLYAICISTRGQLFKIDSLSTALSANNQLFLTSLKGTDVDKSPKAHFYPSVILIFDKQTLPQNYLKNIDSFPEFMQGLAKGEGLSFPIPLIPAESSSFLSLSQEEKLDLFFKHSSEVQSFYPYPEQGKPRGSYPLFRIRLIHEVIPGTSLLVILFNRK